MRRHLAGPHELMRVDESSESAGESLLEVERDENLDVDLS